MKNPSRFPSKIVEAMPIANLRRVASQLMPIGAGHTRQIQTKTVTRVTHGTLQYAQVVMHVHKIVVCSTFPFS
jgi:hypothetical protein